MSSPGSGILAAPSRALAPEVPFFMDVEGLPVYAVLHESVPGRADAPVVVFVHALGVEHLNLYRQEVRTARALAAAGIPALRYHSRGHGDSAGAAADVTLESLVGDARAAADEALRRSGRTRVIWLGVRTGAIVAALAGGPGSERADGAAFVFWEPVDDPAGFFRQQLRTVLISRVAGNQRPEATVDQLLERLQREGSLDVFGYLLQRRLVDSFANRSLAAALTGVRVPVRLAQVQARPKLAPAHAKVLEAVAREQAPGTPGREPVAHALVREEPGYQLMSNPAWQCDELTRVTLEWVDAVA